MTMPPAGPPPGYQGPQGPPPPRGAAQGLGDPTVALSPAGRPAGAPDERPPDQQPSAPPKQPGFPAVLIFGVIAVAAVVLGLSLAEHGHSAWESVNAWGGVAIAAAAATLVPVIAGLVGLDARRAWQVSVCGAGALVLFWVLLVLPGVGSNTSLLTTIGVAAGVAASWHAPGRSEPPERADGQHRKTW